MLDQIYLAWAYLPKLSECKSKIYIDEGPLCILAHISFPLDTSTWIVYGTSKSVYSTVLYSLSVTIPTNQP